MVKGEIPENAVAAGVPANVLKFRKLYISSRYRLSIVGEEIMEYRFDAPIMILFFNRPDTLQQVFAWVRRMQPKQLFLVQDGPRADRSDDMKKIEACRRVVENVDWDCEVRRNYAEQNMSCDHREFTGISWCFQFVDRLMILEDDCVPADSFYGFCAELLEKYKNDQRVFSISGLNRLGEYGVTPYDYVFSRASAGIGWATWKRCWDYVQSLWELDVVDDSCFMRYCDKVLSDSSMRLEREVLHRSASVRNYNRQIGKISSWEYLAGLSAIMNRQLIITPRVNMVKYIGFTEDATHSGNSPELVNHKIRKVLTQSAKELTGAIKHPPAILCDMEFEKRDRKSMEMPKWMAKIELLFLRIKHGQWSSIYKIVRKRLLKYLRRYH